MVCHMPERVVKLRAEAASIWRLDICIFVSLFIVYTYRCIIYLSIHPSIIHDNEYVFSITNL